LKRSCLHHLRRSFSDRAMSATISDIMHAAHQFHPIHGAE
jgi:hypothetical protein